MPHIPINGTDLYYVQTGEGPDVVLIHGLASNLAFWYSGIVLPLRRQYRVTACDLRGHGKSGMPPAGYTHLQMAEDLFCLVEQLELAPFHLVGHSYGGLIAVTFASRHPERLRSLTLADVPISGQASDWRSCYPVLLHELQEAGISICRDDPYPELKILEEMACPQIRSRAKALGAVSSYSPYGYGRGSAKTVERWLKLLNSTTAREDFRLREISMQDLLRIENPTLVTYGMESRWKASGDVLRECLPNVRVVYVENAGHAHPWEKPGEFLQSWLDFVSSIGGRIEYPVTERRRQKRYNISFRLDLRESTGQSYPAEVLNASMTGLLILCPRCLEVNSQLELIAVLDEDSPSTLTKGRVVRANRREIGDGYGLGIEFWPEGNHHRSFAEFMHMLGRDIVDADNENPMPMVREH